MRMFEDVVTCTFRIVHYVDHIGPSVFWCVQDSFHETHPPHALRHGAPEAQAARAGELRGHGGKQDSAVVLGRDLHGLLVFLLRHSNIYFSHLGKRVP